MKIKKLIITSLVGSIGLAVLSLSLSLAWYNTSENLYLDTLVISVSGEQQLLISTTGEDGTFTTDLQFKIEDDPNENTLIDAGLFQPVSSMFKSKWLEDDLKTEPEMYLYTNSSVDGEYAPHEDVADWGYYKQHLYLYCAANVIATIDTEDLVVEEIARLNSTYAYELMLQKNVMEEYHKLHPEYTSEQIHDDILAKLNVMKKCMRIAILDVSAKNFYIVDPYKDGDTYLGGRADLFANKYYDYHREDDGLYETIYGEVTGRENAVYKNTRDVDTDDEGNEISEEQKETYDYTSFKSCTKTGIHAFDLESSLANEGFNIAKEDSLSLAEAEENILLPLTGGEAKEIVLMAYMEGWDTDCTNKHMGGNFNIDLKFKISEEKQ